MRIVEILFSPTGGTKKVADALVRGLMTMADEGCVVDLCDRGMAISALHFTPNDLCVVAVPSYGGRVPVPAAARLALLNANGAKAVLAVAYGNRAYDDTLLELADLAKAAGFDVAAAVAAIAEHSIARCYAAHRPDDSDLRELVGFGQRIRGAVDRGQIRCPALPGNRPYRAFGGVGFYPLPGDSCTGCGVCAAQCPTGAISPMDPRQVDTCLCIGCMRCEAVCPSHARHPASDKVAATQSKLAKLCADRKANELFL